MAERKIILNLAVSLDGYICDPEGGFAWISGQGDRRLDTVPHYDIEAFASQVDVIVMGRKAYEDCGLDFVAEPQTKQFWIASSKPLALEPPARWISGDLVASVLALKKQPGKDIWLFGGAGVTDPFIRADAVDEYIIGIIPILLGQGRRLFHEGFASIALHLEQFWIDDGAVVMRYRRRGETLGK